MVILAEVEAVVNVGETEVEAVVSVILAKAVVYVIKSEVEAVVNLILAVVKAL